MNTATAARSTRLASAKPTKHQASFLSALTFRTLERVQGQKVSGHVWDTQAACERRGWATTRPGNVNTWESWWVLTDAGREALTAYGASVRSEVAAA